MAETQVKIEKAPVQGAKAQLRAGSGLVPLPGLAADGAGRRRQRLGRRRAGLGLQRDNFFQPRRGGRLRRRGALGLRRPQLRLR